MRSRIEPEDGGRPGSIPDGVWAKCPGCKETLFVRELERNARVCPHCQYHFLMDAEGRIAAMLDGGSFKHLRGEGPLWTGTASLSGFPVAVAVASPESVETITATELYRALVPLVERAARDDLPLLVFCAGGSGMGHEEKGIVPLRARLRDFLIRLGAAQRPYLLVVTDAHPKWGFHMPLPLGDLVLAEAAPQKHPPPSQPAEGIGSPTPFVDRYVSRVDLVGELSTLLAFFEDVNRDHGKRSAR